MRKVTFAEGEYYHIYNRGVDKRTTFLDAADYRRFLASLYIMNDQDNAKQTYLLQNFPGLASKEIPPREKDWKPLVALGAYCLMPNHFHLYTTPLVENGVSKFMQRIQTSYTMYFNKKYGRSGSLFQGTFKARHVDSDQYAKYLFSYIHLNPAKLKDGEWKERGARDLKALREHIGNYRYSSLREWVERDHVITNTEHFPGYLTNRKDVDSHIGEWLEHRDVFQV